MENIKKIEKNNSPKKKMKNKIRSSRLKKIVQLQSIIKRLSILRKYQ
jgi:hypothetical protein